MGLLPFILCQIGGLGIPLAATYELAHRPRAARAVRSLLVRVVPLQALALLSAHLAILFALFHNEGRSVWIAALLTIPSVPALLVQQLGLGILQGQQRFTAFNILRMLPLAAYAIVLSVVALGGQGTLIICALSWSGAWLLAGVATIRTALSGLRGTAGDLPVARSAFFRFGRRGVLGSVFPLEAFQIDQLIVGLIFSPAALGIYVVAAALTNLPRFVAHSVGMVAYPRTATQLDRYLGLRSMWGYFGIALALSVPIVGALELGAGWLIPLFFGNAYSGAVPLARLLLISALFLAARRVLADGARGLGHPELGTAAEVASWFVLVPAVVLLQSRGPEGVALAMVVTYGASLGVLVLGVALRIGLGFPRRPSYSS